MGEAPADRAGAGQLPGGVELRFGADGLVPAVVQDARSGRVLMVAYMNREALARTVATGDTWFWSRSRQALWHKGESSGAYQRVCRISADCDGDALLVEVVQEGGGACHTGAYSCFHRPVLGGPQGGAGHEGGGAPGAGVLESLEAVIRERRARPEPGSYTAYLFREGLDKILKKVGEEAAEVVIAAKGSDLRRITEEAADLVYHLSVLLVERGLGWGDVLQVLERRRQGAPGAGPG